jgi:hypothetical protein
LEPVNFNEKFVLARQAIGFWFVLASFNQKLDEIVLPLSEDLMFKKPTISGAKSNYI